MEYGTSFSASRAHGMFRSLQDTVYNMNLAHLSQEERTVFESLDDAGLRTACTTYLIYRGRHRHEPSRDSPYVRLAEAAQFRHSVWGPAGAVLRGPVRHPQHRLLVDPGHARPARPPRRVRGREAGGRRRVRLPAVQPARQRLVLAPRGPGGAAHLDRRRGRRPGPPDGRGGRPGRVPGRARGDRDVRPLARPGRGGHEPVRARCPAGGCSSPWTWTPRPPSWRCARARGRRRSTSWTATGREATAARVAADLDGVAGVDVVARLEGGRAVVGTPRGELRFAPGGSATDDRGQGWDVDGDLEALDLSLDGGHAGLRRLPGRAPAAVVGGHLRAHRRPAAVRRAGVRVHRLGRRRPRRRRQPRLAARVRLAGRPADLRRRTRTAAPRARGGRSRTSRRWCWTTSAWGRDVRARAPPAHPHPRARGHGAAPQLGPAGQVRAWSAGRATW